jgi:hypothetical protein
MRAEQDGQVRVSFVMRAAKATLHEPVYIEFSIHNGLPEAVRLDLGANAVSKFDFSILDPAGAWHRIGPLRQPPFHGPGRLELLPGKSFRKALLLNEWYQFRVPGKYQVQPHLAAPVQTAGGAVVPMALPPTLAIEVLPRDAQRLRSVCAKLAAVATSPASRAPLDAAETLSYVLDLEAVPYLVQVAHGDPALRSIAVDGLARIAQARGLESVLEALGPNNAELRTATKQAVYNLEHGISAVD